MTSIALRRLAFLFPAVLFLSVAPLQAQREKLPSNDLDVVEKKWPNAKRTYTGLRYVVVKPGKGGGTAEPGMVATVLYKGMLLDGTVFDESPDADHPLKARIGRSELIAGWDEALQKMHEGEKWVLIVPPEMAYGARGKPPRIPRDATLVFEMEMVSFGRN